MASDHSIADSFICNLGSIQDTAKYMEMDMVCTKIFIEIKLKDFLPEIYH